MKVQALKDLLQDRGLRQDGKKSELIERLHESDKGSESPVVLPAGDSVADAAVSEQNLLLPELSNTGEADDSSASSVEASCGSMDALAGPTSCTKGILALTDQERKAMRLQKFGAVTDHDKLAQRAKRFGVSCPALETERRAKRAMRFGIDQNDKTNVSKQVDRAEQLRRLKRVERFGIVDEDEKQRKRQNRFGTLTEEAKLRKRLARFAGKVVT